MHIGIVGAGNVGVGVADALAYLGIGKRVTLYNRHIERALGEVWDLNDSIPLLTGDMIFHATDDFEALRSCEVIVITVGAKQKPGETRLDLLNANYQIIKEIIPRLDVVNPTAKIIMVTNPVDVLTRVAITLSKREPRLIFGSGTVLDTIRLREAIGERIDVNRKNIHAYVVGEHGESEFPLWSACHVGSVGLESFGIEQLETFKRELAEQVRQRAYRIIEKKGFTKQAIGTSVAHLIKSILLDEKSLYTVSVPIEDVCGCIRSNVALSIPCVIGKGGIEKRLSIQCTQEEFASLKASAEKLDHAYHTLS